MTNGKQTNTKDFEEKLRKQLNKADFSKDSRYEVMRKYLVELLSSKQLYQEVAKRKDGLCILEYYPNAGVNRYSLGLATLPQIERSALSYTPDLPEEDDNEDTLKTIMPRKYDLALVEIEYNRLDSRSPGFNILHNVITLYTCSNKRAVIPAIKDISSTFGINSTTLEKKLFNAIKDIETRGLFSD